MVLITPSLAVSLTRPSRTGSGPLYSSITKNWFQIQLLRLLERRTVPFSTSWKLRDFGISVEWIVVFVFKPSFEFLLLCWRESADAVLSETLPLIWSLREDLGCCLSSCSCLKASLCLLWKVSVGDDELPCRSVAVRRAGASAFSTHTLRHTHELRTSSTDRLISMIQWRVCCGMTVKMDRCFLSSPPSLLSRAHSLRLISSPESFLFLFLGSIPSSLPSVVIHNMCFSMWVSVSLTPLPPPFLPRPPPPQLCEALLVPLLPRFQPAITDKPWITVEVNTGFNNTSC